MPTTTNFGWTTPADTDLVKDGAAAIRTLGNGIDTSLIDLKGGTTGQVLSKASNTDLDYSWVTPNVGDITEVQAGTGISVASGTGPIPVVTNTVATAFDAAGDLVYGTGADTFTKLSLGTAGQVLTVNTGATAPEWKTPAGKVLQVVSATTTTTTTVSSTTWTDSGLSASITPSSTNSKILVLISQPTDIGLTSGDADLGGGTRLLRSSTTIFGDNSASGPYSAYLNTSTSVLLAYYYYADFSYLDSPSTTSSTTYKTQIACNAATSGETIRAQAANRTASIILLEIGA